MRDREELPYHIINFNFETVQVTWNASEDLGTNLTFRYRFRGKDCGPCPNYILRHGRTVGCVFKAEGDEVMDFSILKGTHRLFFDSVWISDYLKPNAPRDLHFHWHEESVTVTCADLPYRSLQYEVQHKSIYDNEWQSQEEETCNVTIAALDADRCYCFRARVKALESSYGFDTHPSDWSQVAHWQKGELRDSCEEKSPFPKLSLIYGLVTFLILLLIPLSLWKLQRVKKVLVPSVPDPKFTFPGLFEAHHGNFQEWIKDTQNVAVLNKAEDKEQELVLEATLEVQMPLAKAEAPVVTVMGPSCPPTEEEEAAGDPGPRAGPPPPGEERVSLRGFTFVVGDNAYVTL
ncbi:cytokine receptor-like factor 2 [Pteronotus mesoamericanus]|uniref:cytokine receptor-like factor 2 n=1 Tax=Pteronotus mesoamericanus TaxID=1884717 RepID=UPI0023EB6E0C|nr:cytokine receptor-like factor 2 [Pteronotus parnellii mesoamericanus]